ncbi:MAG: hypothetical protein FWD71_12555 [Oscillospiraceae bacterium]|nr:hypothetical protein [Oscillospiraceae bacterium]
MKFKTYKYIPKKEIKNASIFSGICFFAAAALLISSVFISNFRIVYELSAVIFATIGVQVTARFILSGYVYILDQTNFIILKITGKKSVQMCNISLENSVAVSQRHQKFSEVKVKFGKIPVRKNFCQNMFSAASYVYVFEFDEKKSAVIFEADENFIKEMRTRINCLQLLNPQ